ncbi:DUF5597 domain-containing protein [Xanthomonas maliensis]|uniref:DUF5597 domain-containing protein n=1 Tax=Xanthomonas maliensis TaxID=1321368 RepID=UPI0003A2D773|nr:DUF5597 domain-containing protein [Xanthomonas maliensis]KAB7764431.1 hypothetical protein CKY51_17505 [Xanthomonas maliensis]
MQLPSSNTSSPARSTRRRCYAAIALLLALLPPLMLQAQPNGFAAAADGRRSFTVDGKPWLLLGMQLNNSSGTGTQLRQLQPALARSQCNTVMAPVSWQELEPVAGRYDFANVDGLVNEARRQGLRLVLLWFGTWKNGGMAYVPDWVKRDTLRYPRVIDADGHPVEALSPLAAASRDADAQAFAALMRHLRDIDGKRRTVLMVQVENEAGTLGADRDHSAAAQALFAGQVPADMPGAASGNWTAAFGARAPEAFMAYHTARYMQAVAAAGKAAYDLPLYINVWPREQPGLLRPGLSSPSGGAVSWLLPMWKALAPAIDVIGVDNYDTNVAPYLAIAQAYDRKDNPLFVPETGGSAAHARHMFLVLARPYAVGIGKFGIDAAFGLDADGRESIDPVAVNYRLLREAAPFLLPLRDAGRVQAAVEEDGIANVPLAFSQLDVAVRFGEVCDGYGGPRGQGNQVPSGRVLVAEVAPERFLITGANANLMFAEQLGTRGPVQLLTVEEGHFEAGRWVRERTLNGDETYFGLRLPERGSSLMVTLLQAHRD